MTHNFDVAIVITHHIKEYYFYTMQEDQLVNFLVMTIVVQLLTILMFAMEMLIAQMLEMNQYIYVVSNFYFS